MEAIWPILLALVVLSGVGLAYRRKQTALVTVDLNVRDVGIASGDQSRNTVESDFVEDEAFDGEPDPFDEVQGFEIPVTTDIYINYPTYADMDEDKVEMLKSLTGALPELPHVSLDLLPLLSKPGAGMSEIAKLIERDQATAARLMRWVNSGFYGLEKKVESLHRAVTLLGLDTVRSAVIYDSFNRSMNPRGFDGLDTYRIWAHSSAVSMAAKELSKRIRGIEPEVAATAGLLHNIGLVLLLTTERDKLQQTVKASYEEGDMMIDHEDEYIGFNHQTWGECFIREWGLPDIIAEAVGNHHNPMGERTGTLGTLVWLADYIVTGVGFECPKGNRMLLSDEDEHAVLEKLGLRASLWGYVTERFVRKLNESASMWKSYFVPARTA